MNSRTKIKILCIGLLISTMVLGSCVPPAKPTTAPQTLTKVTFRLSWTKEGTYASYYLAKEKGFYADEGLDVQILEGSGSGTSVQAVASGENTFAMADGTSVQGAVHEGTPVITVATINQLSPYGLICRKDANVNTVADVVGKKVIIAGGSGEALIFPAFLTLNGVDPATVTVVSGESSVMGPAIIRGDVQCAVEFASAFIGFTKQQAPDLELIALMFGEFGANTVSQGIIAKPDTLTQHPEWVRSFVKATLRGNDYAVDHVSEAIDALLKDSPDLNRETETELLNAAISTWHVNQDIPWGCSYGPDWTFSENLMIEQGVFTKTMPLDQYFTNEFVPETCP